MSNFLKNDDSWLTHIKYSLFIFIGTFVLHSIFLPSIIFKKPSFLFIINLKITFFSS